MVPEFQTTPTAHVKEIEQAQVQVACVFPEHIHHPDWLISADTLCAGADPGTTGPMTVHSRDGILCHWRKRAKEI